MQSAPINWLDDASALCPDYWVYVGWYSMDADRLRSPLFPTVLQAMHRWCSMGITTDTMTLLYEGE